MTECAELKKYAMTLLSRREFGFDELCKKLKLNFSGADSRDIENIVQELEDYSSQAKQKRFLLYRGFTSRQAEKAIRTSDEW